MCQNVLEINPLVHMQETVSLIWDSGSDRTSKSLNSACYLPVPPCIQINEIVFCLCVRGYRQVACLRFLEVPPEPLFQINEIVSCMCARGVQAISTWFRSFFHFWNNRFCLTFYNIYKISPRLSEKFTLSSKQYCIVKKMKNKLQILIFRDLSMTRAQCFSNMHGFFQFLRHMPVANKFFRNLNQMKLG